MKAFLSHSSRDKAVVTQIAEQLGGANVELDADSFDRGILNVEAIGRALKRSSIFVLFLSEDSLQSAAVLFEANLARELQMKGLIQKFFVVCLDEASFKAAPDAWKEYNFVRRPVSPQSVARLIQGEILTARSREPASAPPFVGRQAELTSTKDKLVDPEKAATAALYVSGTPGIGRRTFARKLYADVFAPVTPVFPQIYLDRLDGYEEIFRKLLDVLTPFATLSAYRTHIVGFAVANEATKLDLISAQINRLLEAREALFILDDGGILEDPGGFQPHIRLILDKIGTAPHPALIFVSNRMMPHAMRANVTNVVFSPLSSLADDDIRQLVGLLLKRHSIAYTSEELEQLTELADGHPFNVNFMVEAIRHYTLSVFLADTSSLVQWKRNRASEFLLKIDFSESERKALAALRDFRILDFETLVEIVGDASDAAAAATKLIDYHIIEAAGNSYALSPPVRAAVERDSRFNSSNDQRQEMLRAVAQTLQASTDDPVSVSMVNAAILAELQSGGELSEFFSAFLLPSHYVWLARRQYDSKHYEECIRLSRKALESVARLSPAGVVEACRYLCLAASRSGSGDAFEEGLAIIRRRVADSWARSNLEFLLGFNNRMKGNLPVAEEHFREAYKLSPGNFWAARELASVCSKRGDAEGAEQFARRAYEVAPDSPFVLDILLSVLINLPDQRQAGVREEIDYLFDRFNTIRDVESRSFYTTRRAEYALRQNNLAEAVKFIDEATRKTPNLFAVQELRARIYLERGNNVVAAESISNLQRMIDRNTSGERRTNIRPLLEIRSSYLAATGQFEEAKQLYRNKDIFTDSETATAIRKIEIEQAYRKHKK